MIESDIYRMPNGDWGVTVRQGFYRVHEHGFKTQAEAEAWRDEQTKLMEQAELRQKGA